MKRDFSALRKQSFDMVIIGGGIYGAWTAYLAAQRGLKVAIIEKNDWASGSSSASTKLIHGGLRYLEQLHFGLVKKALLERQLLCHHAPHLVVPINFVVPLYAESRISPFRMNIGLSLYTKLAGNHYDIHPYRQISKEVFGKTYPFMSKFGTSSIFSYYDAQTDDARFTLEVIKGARALHAVALNYCETLSLLEKKGTILGALVRDGETGQEQIIHAPVVVNCAGYGLHNFLGNYKGTPLTRFTKGIHLILPPLPTKDAFLIFAKKDGRVMFLIPWYGKTLLGTTDTHYEGKTEKIPISNEDISYLLNEANNVLHNITWKKSDICGSFSGLRVLQNTKNVSPSSVSREWVVKNMQPGLLVSVGGKFTTARQDGLTIVDQAIAMMKQKPKDSLLRHQDSLFMSKPKMDIDTWRKDTLQKSLYLGIDRETSQWLQFRFGSSIDAIHEYIKSKKNLKNRIDKELPFCKSEIVYACHHEMALHLDDIIRRRIPLVLLNKMSEKTLVDIARLSGKCLGWKAKKRNNEIDRAAKLYL